MKSEKNISHEELRRYALRHLVAHLAEAEEFRRLFDLLDTRDFLIHQAEVCGFQQCGEDLERYALPAAIDAGYWEGFLHYALAALNLRGLAESLTDEAVLRALARAGRFDLTEGAIARLSDPARRAAARSIIASIVGRESDLFQQFLRDVVRDCEVALSVSRSDLPDMVVTSLTTVARELGTELFPTLSQWYERMGPSTEAAMRVAWAVAESHLEVGQIEAPGLWKALECVNPSTLLKERLPERLGCIAGADPWPILDRLRPILGSDEAFWQAAVRLLGRWVQSTPNRALAAWESLQDFGPIPWSEIFVDAGTPLFRMLPPERIDALAESCHEPTAHTALRVLAFVAEPATGRAAAALQAVSAVTQESERLCWTLRYLIALPRETEVERQFCKVCRHLHEIHYDIPAMDCARYLDLAARFLNPRDLAFELESMTFSPGFGPEALRTVISEVTVEPVLTEILERAERYAAMVARNEREGFTLRAELISSTVRRLCLSRGDLKFLEDAVQRLLVDEEDELRAALAIELRQAGLLLQGRQVAEGIRESRLRFQIQLQILGPEDLNNHLSASELYKSVVTIEAVEQELCVLTALLEEPVHLEKLVGDYVTPIRDPGLQLLGLLRLGHHALISLKSPNRQDRAAAVDAVRPGIVIGSDDLLTALTPAIAELGAGRGVKQAFVEFQQAAERLLSLGSSWKVKRDALEDLLARLGRIILPEVNRARRSSLRQAATVLEAVLQQPVVLEPEWAREELRRRWNEVLPLVLAGRDRLPQEVRRQLDRVPLVWPGWQEWGSSAGCLAEWRSVLELCQKAPEEWSREASCVVSSDNPDPALIYALVYLLASHESERIPNLIAKIPPSAERDGLCLRLLRHGWLSAPVGAQLLSAMSSPDVRLEAELFVPKELLDGSWNWTQNLAVFLARVGLDPSNPASEPLLHRLWREDPEAGQRDLARAVLDAMREGGAPRGEAALRVWLHIHLAPRLGAAQPEKLELGHRALAAIHKACSLSPEIL